MFLRKGINWCEHFDSGALNRCAVVSTIRNRAPPLRPSRECIFALRRQWNGTVSVQEQVGGAFAAVVGIRS